MEVPIRGHRSINGMCGQAHATIEETMARVEHELLITGDAFVASYAGYRAHRPVLIGAGLRSRSAR
jgi:hypothetical protein